MNLEHKLHLAARFCEQIGEKFKDNPVGCIAYGAAGGCGGAAAVIGLGALVTTTPIAAPIIAGGAILGCLSGLANTNKS